MSARKTTIHVEKLSRTDYHVSKNIPDTLPNKNTAVEKNPPPKKALPTPFPFDLLSLIREKSPESPMKSGSRQEKIPSARKPVESSGALETIKEKEEENTMLRESVANLNTTISMLKSELEENTKKNFVYDVEFKTRIAELENQKQIDDKMMNELKVLVREKTNFIDETKISFDMEVNLWKKKTKEKEAEIERIKSERNQVQEVQKQLEVENEKYKNEMREFQNSTSLLQQQLRTAQESFSKQESLIEDWKKKYKQLEAINSQDVDFSTQQLNQKEQEINELRTALLEERRNHQTQIQELKSETLEIENKLVLLCEENEQIHSQNKELQDELEKIDLEHQTELEQLQHEFEAAFNEKMGTEIEQRTSYLEKQNKEQTSSIQHLLEKRQSVEQHCKALEKELEILSQNHIQQYEEAAHHASNEILSLQNEIERLTIHYEHTLKEKLDNQLNTFKEEINHEKVYWEARLAEVSIQRDDYKLMHSQILSELEKANEASVDIAAENKALREKMDELSKEIFDSQQTNSLKIQKNEIAFEEAHRKVIIEKTELEEQHLQTLSKVQHHELQLVLFMIELERLHEIISEKESVANLWREQILEIEASYKSHVEDLNNKISELEAANDEKHRENIKSRNQQMTLETNNIELNNTVKRLENILEESESQVKNSRMELAEKSFDITQIQDELTRLKGGYEGRIEYLTSELQTKNQENLDLQSNKFLRERLELEKTYSEKIIEIEKQFKKRENEFSEKYEAIKQEKAEVIIENNTLKVQIEDLKRNLKNQKSDLTVYNTEKERLSELLQMKEQEIRSLDEKIISLETLRQQEIHEMTLQHDKHTNELVTNELQILNEKLHQERVEYESKGKVLRQQVSELEDKVLLVSTELHRMNFQYNQKIEEIEKLERLVNQKSSENSELKLTIESIKATNKVNNVSSTELKQKINQLESHISEIERDKISFKALYLESKAQTDALKNRMMNTAEITSSLKQNEVEHLIKASRRRENESDENYNQSSPPRNENEQVIYLNKQLRDTRIQLNTKNTYYKELEAEYMILKGKYEQLYKEAEELQFSRDAHFDQIAKSDLSKKHKELVKKIQEVDDLKRRYEDALGELDPITTSTSRIVTRISIRKDSK